MQQISVIKACHAVSQTEIYALDSIIHPSNDWGQNSNQFYRESTKLQSTDKNSLTQAQKTHLLKSCMIVLKTWHMSSKTDQTAS